MKNPKGLFNDNTQPVLIEAHFRLREAERAYIKGNAAELLEETIWQSILPEAFQYGSYTKALFAAQFRERQPEVTARVKAELPGLLAELTRDQHIAQIEVQPNGNINAAPSRLLSVVFTNYRPREIGVIDFHGAQRHYGRENVSGINLNLEQTKQQQSASTPYNYSNKYANVKSEMAGNFITELLAEKASAVKGGVPSLTDALKELFETFFPDKKFMGPRPTIDGGLEFPVQTQGGHEHDLDELSSGEKEILYGYLRIRSSAPKGSIILLDEPELHLNPRLIRGLPEFYRKHLSVTLDNQLWLVTHSDALIREAVGKPGFNVFHMTPCGASGAEENQLAQLSVTQDLERVLADLVGDLAAYRPGGKGLIFEGGGDSEFDKSFVSSIFADEIRGINLIPGTNKARVELLHEVLQAAHEKGDLPTKFYAIVDKDADLGSSSPAVNRYQWDVYHIENYLLNPQILADVLNSLVLNGGFTPASVNDDLRKAAHSAVNNVLAHRMRIYVRSRMMKSIDVSFNPKSDHMGNELNAAAERTVAEMQRLTYADLSQDNLKNVEAGFRAEVEQSLADGSWLKDLPGREILKRFVSDLKVTVSYQILRNLAISRMAEEGYKPQGMKKIIDQIVAN